MLGQDQENECPPGGGAGGGGGGGRGLNRKTYLRSVSWSDRSPRKSNQRPPPSSKPRLCLPTLPRLSISKPSFEEWPKAGSDDLGIWPQAATPGPRGSSAKPLPSPNVEHPPREEFLFKKDKLAFFDKECSKIIDHIYLGSDAVAKNREVLSKNNITHVLNCVGFVCPEYFKNDLVYKTLWLQDSPSEDITSILYDVFDYFEDVREQGGRVLVHCYQGVSRSTSLVIAYVMWKERQSFDEAFQYVKAARGVTNPNMGFACQLLLCQNRALAFLESPNSVLRMYRMAPHSPYDPLHLVPKMLSETGPQGLDSRGSFVIHAPSAVYVWVGVHCVSAMTDSARTAAYQVIKYEMAQGPVLISNEGEETREFWEALVDKESIVADENVPVGERKVGKYDLDFEIFHKALSGGVVPLLPLSGTISETCLPARENGWGKLRQKFASGLMKKFITSSKLSCGAKPSVVSDSIHVEDLQSPSRFRSGSFTNYPDKIKDSCKEVDYSSPLPAEPLLSRTSSCTSLDSFSSFLVNSSPKFSSKSPSLSPSTSDYSSSFTFSPSSSNWSDSFQSSPSGGASPNLYLTKDKDGSLAEHTCVLCEAKSPCKGISPSIAERRGSNPPPLMKLPKVTDGAHAPRKLVRSYSFSLPEFEDDVMTDIDQDEEEPLCTSTTREESMLDADMSDAGNELQCQTADRIEFGSLSFPSGDALHRITEAEASSLVLYKWPSMDKVKVSCSALLDSRCVYIALISGVNMDSNDYVVYVWLGRESSCGKCQKEMVDADGSCQVSPLQWETIGTRFLKQMGLPADSPVQVVKEGEEPEQFLKHLNSFSISLGR